MNPRERYLETLLFGTPDKVPFEPGGPREKTLARWHTEGLPEGTHHMAALFSELGIEPEKTQKQVQPGINFRMNPQFEEKVLEHKDGHYIVQDWMGNVTEISDEYDYTYIRSAKDFVTRKWHKFPVETPEDFEEMKKRYDPDDPTRYPKDFEERVKRMRNRDYVTSITCPGPFWQLREWCGFEPLCMLCLDNPEFVQHMAEFWAEFMSKTMTRLLDARVLDRIQMNEDMAYKEKSMISPDMTRRFLMPVWERWSRETKEAGVLIVDMDSDGKVDELIPLWIEAGINVCDPIEVAAGNDINEYRRIFGKSIAYRQGVDKRCMAKGGSVIEDEMTRIAPVVADGGFIPGCDHGVPFDISWPNFIHFGRLLAEMTGWL